jgi:hypothetical protein
MDFHWLKWVAEGAIGFAGGVASYFALPKLFGEWWIEKVKAAHAKQLESLRASIERSTFVTRSHFETEFAAVKDAFKCLSEVRLRMNELRPNDGVGPLGEAKDAKKAGLQGRLLSLKAAYNALLEQTEVLSPFYPAELYEAFRKCIKASNIEIMDVMTADSPGDEQSFSLEWYKRGRANREAFQAAYDEVGKIIRDRLSNLAVLPST